MSELLYQRGSCAELPAFWVDKYFHANLNRNPDYGRVALAVCAHCPIVEECRDEAVQRVTTSDRGIVGGTTVNRVLQARRWRTYELGVSDSVPPFERPHWLKMNDATNTVEQRRLEADPDERLGA